MNKSETLSELAPALCKAQTEIKTAEMNAVNPFLRNKYADLGSVIEAVRGALAKNNLAVTQLVGGDGVAITLETVLVHASGEWISSTVALPIGEEKGKSSAQVAGSIITYLRRYGLASMLGVYADEDTDGSGNGHKPTPAQPAQQAQPQTQNASRKQLEPDELEAALDKKAQTYAGRNVSDKQRKLFNITFANIFDNDEARHKVQGYLFGVESLNDVTDEQVLSALDWLKPTKNGDGKYQPDITAANEALAVLRHINGAHE